jgi:haloalkane dehalogenase
MADWSDVGKLERASIYPPDYPYQPQFIEINGRCLAYLDEGQGEKTILMVHGNPVSGYVYDRLLRLLVGEFRCVVPDLVGFGLSDKPPGEADYSLPGHIAIMEAFVEALDLRDIVLVGHDWGGPIGFGAAVRRQERYTQLVFLNTMTAAPMQIRPVYWLPFHVLLRIKRLFAYLVKDRNLFQQLGVAIMDPEDQAVYFRANHSPATRAGIAAFPRMIPFRQSHANFPILREILAALKRWDIPSLVIFSDKDSVFTAAQGKRFAGQLRNGRFVLVPGAKHFLQYQRPAAVAEKIRTFLTMPGI